MPRPPIIQTIDEHFELPQLIKTRRITALLPGNYLQSDRRYPVLYLQDGQNLFDDHAPFGSWEVDKHLARMADEGTGDLIVIAIDHAKEERIAEYTPSVRTRLGKGDGLLYADFLAHTLKPYVDRHFRTLTGRDHTGIGGSSMGGLISLYAAMRHPDVYSRLLIFSPSLWVSPKLPFEFLNDALSFHGRIYLYGGAKEGSDMVRHMRQFEEWTRPHFQRIALRTHIRDDGEHNEFNWGRVFPEAVRYLYNP